MPARLAAFLIYFRSCRPLALGWAQKISDELPEVNAVFVPLEGAPSAYPSFNGETVLEEVSLVAVEGHHCTEGPHIDRSSIRSPLKKRVQSVQIISYIISFKSCLTLKTSGAI